MHRKISAKLPAIILTLTGLLTAADPAGDALKNSGSLDRLVKKTGVYNASNNGKTPGFVVDPSWPQPLPNHWLLGQIGGLYVDQHDHVWVYNRPRTLSTDEAGLEGPIPGATDDKGHPIDGLGQERSYGPVSDCCKAAPSVLEFDSDGKLLRAWGGPADPGFIGGKCKADAGCIWPNNEHGIYVDHDDNVWISGNQAAPSGGAQSRQAPPWTSHKEGGDGFVLKFDMNGHFKMRIGGTPAGPNSNDTNSGINGTPALYLAADMVVDPANNHLYIADGYGNRRVLIVDANTGKYIGHFGAYGNNPVDDASAEAAGSWIADSTKGNRKPAFFRNPVHCVKIANDGKLYVCDRGNDRLQVFDKNDPTLGKPCSNPSGKAGTCGFLAEQFVSDHTNIIGTAVSMNFSTDKAQSCLYVGDNANMTIYILNRSNLQELGQLGRHGRGAGEFHYLHQVSVDSKGNIYTGEVDTAKRIQKFLRFGATGCSGTGSPTVGGVAANSTARSDQNSMLAHEQLLAKSKQGRIDVYFEGDSITRRWGATDYPYLLANWKQNFFGWNAADFGWGADRVENILWRLENGELDGVNPKVIVLLAGTNNVDNHEPPEGITTGLEAVVRLMQRKAPNATIILTAIFPRNDNSNNLMPVIDRINANLAHLADGANIRFLNINRKLAAENGKLLSGMMNPDLLHPSLQGYQVWADALKPILLELLGPPASEDHAPPPTGDPSAGNNGLSAGYIER